MPLLSLCWYCIFQALILLIVANGAPVITSKLLSNRLMSPMDNGLILSDGYRLFGSSKTWRGLFSAILFSTAAATLFEFRIFSGCIVRHVDNSRGFAGELYQALAWGMLKAVGREALTRYRKH